MRMQRAITRRCAATAAIAMSAIVLNATTAHASVPTWETEGYQPTCDSVNTVTSTPTFQYEDQTKPTILSFTRVPIIRVGIVAKYVNIFSTRVKDSCSGVLSVGVTVLNQAGSLFEASSGPTSGTPHDATVTYGGDVVPSSEPFGKVTYLSIRAVDRYNSFQLTNSFTTPSETVASSGSSKVATSQINYGLVTYIARDTRLTNASNRTQIRSGRSVTLSGRFTFADVTSYYGLNDVRIKLQSRLQGSRTWSTIAIKRTSGVYPLTSGSVSFTIKPTKTADYRMVFSGALTAPYWFAPVTSSSKRVSVV